MKMQTIYLRVDKLILTPTELQIVAKNVQVGKQKSVKIQRKSMTPKINSDVLF
jgi:hypothetical protein